MANSAGYKLRNAAHKHLTDPECTTLKICIKRFRETQSVLGLCTALQKFLDTPENVHMMTLIFPMIPADLRVDFDNLSRLQFEYYSTLVRPKLVDKYKLDSPVKKPSPNKGRERKSSARVFLPVEQLHNIAEAREHTMQTFKGHQTNLQRNHSQQSVEVVRFAKDHKRSKTYHATEEVPCGRNTPDPVPVVRSEQQPTALNISHTSSDSTPRVRLGELKQNATPKPLKVRRVTLERREGQSFGFCIRGGVDLNTGIFVSEVDPGGQAERKGMKVGERILKVNNIVFKNITHSQAVVAIKSAPRIHVYLAPLGQMPGSVNNTPRPSLVSGTNLGSQQWLGSSQELSQEETKTAKGRKVTILAEEDGWLGFSIRGGMDQNIDVSVASVDPSSPADRAGLKKGELITRVNGADVSGLEHMQIINLVLSASIVVLHVKPAPRKSSQSSDHTSKMRARHVSSSSSTGGKSCKDAPKIDVDVSPTRTTRRRGPKSPIPETDMEIAQFVAEMQSTPPVCTSTPLPPDDDPRLIKNRNQYLRERYNGTATDETTILQMMRARDEMEPLQLDLNLSSISGRSVEQDTTARNLGSHPGNAGQKESPRRRSKFEQGTIRMNLADPSDKEAMKEAKLINIDIDIDGDGDNHVAVAQRVHVKDLFEQKQETNRQHSPLPGQLKKEVDIPDGFTPRMNILSSPYTHYDRERQIKADALSPSSKDLKSAVGTASSQIRKELSGKHPAMTTCNLPPSPHMTANRSGSSPVSKFIHKVLRRGSGGKELLKGQGGGQSSSAGSRESLNSGYGSLKLSKIESSSSLGRTAYDLMKMGASDLSSADGD
ncbi:uncharacterized protein [Diadema antillarum]|uniref:uncharacterized protein n=1 Tax=Diadema antillarum TaxID=105358 RepID=UPI003A841D9A